jgi:hypothetical protein
MQNRNIFSFLCRLTMTIRRFNSICLFLLLTVCQAVAGPEVKAEHIDFSQYPEETGITDQYKDLGVLFSGEKRPPIISHPDFFGVNDPALYACADSDSISLNITFIDPESGNPAEATNFKIHYYAGLHSDIKLIFYNLNGDIIDQHEISLPEPDPKFKSPSRFHKLGVTSSTSIDKFWLDWINFDLSSASPASLASTTN